MLAAFMLALLTKRTHALGANIGIVVGVLLNMYLWLYVPQVFWFWWNAIGCVATFVTAFVISTIIPKDAKKGIPFALNPSKKEVVLLLGYFLVIVIISLLLKSFLEA